MPGNTANKSARAKPRSSVLARTLSERAPTLMMSQRDFDGFAEAMGHPPKPKATLRRLMARR